VLGSGCGISVSFVRAIEGTEALKGQTEMVLKGILILRRPFRVPV
jgi:hypothetical protein